MWFRLAVPAVILLVMATGPASAQDSKPTEGRTQSETKTKAEQVRERLSRALRLPETVVTSREAGVDEKKVKEVLKAARSRGVPASETQQILEAENEEIKRGGDPDNFGAAVHQMKASGLRGRDLAHAIHEEQIARGMKKPKPGRGADVREAKRGNRGGKGTQAESPAGRVDDESKRTREVTEGEERKRASKAEAPTDRKPKSKGPKSKGPKKPKGK